MGTSSQLLFAFPALKYLRNRKEFLFLNKQNLMNVNLISCSVNELFAGIMPENINYGLLLSVTILLG